MKKMSLSQKILFGLISGLVVGLALYQVREVLFVKNILLDFVFNLVGNIFIRGIRMIVIPLVFFSLMLGVASIEDVSKLGRLGAKTLGFYMATTIISVGIALFIGNIMNPGIGVAADAVQKVSVIVNNSKSFIDVLLGMVPVNPIEAMAKGDMLAIITFAIISGVALSLLKEKGNNVRTLVIELNNLSLKLVEIVMLLAPYGVFCLIAKMFATLGYTAVLPIIKYVVAVIIALFILVITIYPIILITIAKYSPIKFIKKFFPVMVLAFSTSSSAACLPTSMKTVEEEFNVSNTIASFALPLGNTINMNGTSIMQGIATIFIAQVYGVELTMANYVSIIITATLASIGTAGVPGVGVIMLGMVLTEVGLPIEGIALVMGIDRIVDMFRTVVNVTGDAVCTVALARSEGENLK
ncbi:MAG: dicarboxylate/amino acid:cation symporter [Fusobacteriaceae bacterium]